MHDTVEVTALMHCSLLVVASRMGNQYYAPTHVQLPPCEVFLAPSTIPGGACIRIYTYETTKFCVLCRLPLPNFCILNKLVVLVISACSCAWKFEQCAYAAALYLLLMNFTGRLYSIKLKFAPWFQTAGFGVFAGRAFKQDETVLQSWITLFLPKNFPKTETVANYMFDHNKTHNALVLDYGSVFNHYESANTKAISIDEPPPKIQNENIYFQVRAGFPFGNHMLLKDVVRMHAHMHNACTYT